MVETEMDIQTKGFDAFLEEEKGEFEAEELKEFTWVRRIQSLNPACILPNMSGDQNPLGGALASQAMPIVENLVRKVVIEVEWQEGSKTRFASLSQFLINEKGLSEILPNFQSD